MRLTVKGAHELRATAQALRKGAARVRPEVTKSMKTAAGPTLRKVQNNMATMRIRGFRVRRAKTRFTSPTRGGNIRRRIVRVTELEVSTGVQDPRMRFVVRVDRLGNARNVPRHLDSGKRYRHPVMGVRSTWASSQGEPWFRQPILRDIKVIRMETDKGLSRVVQIIERG